MRVVLTNLGQEQQVFICIPIVWPSGGKKLFPWSSMGGTKTVGWVILDKNDKGK